MSRGVEGDQEGEKTVSKSETDARCSRMVSDFLYSTECGKVGSDRGRG